MINQKLNSTLILFLVAVALGLFLILIVPSGMAEEEKSTVRKSLPTLKTTNPPTIDADLNDPCWKDAPQATGFTDALLGTQVADQTIAYLLYDEKNIYVAFFAYDAQPEKIIARETKQGVRFRGEDMVAFSIDTFHNHKFADRSFFVVNPLGTRFAKIGGGTATKTEWEGDWRTAAKIVEEGWVVEMAIPWAILNYPSTEGPTTVGINFDRSQERTKVHSWWSNVGPQEFLELDGHWEGVQMPAAKFQRRLSLLPYAYLGKQADNSPEKRIGLDTKFAITSGMKLVASANPDFANVEQAVESIDFSYGERSIVDRRPFFSEGSSVYQTGNLAGQFVYTPRIPDFDLGMNLYGKPTKSSSVGMLGAFGFDERNDVILRGRQEFSATSSVDFAFIESRNREDTNRVLVLGENYRFREFSIDANWAQSWVESTQAGSTGNLSLIYRGKRAWARVAPYFIQPDFRDDVGFFPFTDFRGYNLHGGYRTEWREGFLRSAVVVGSMDNSRHYNGELFKRNGWIAAGVETRNDYHLSVKWDGGRFEKYQDGVLSVNLQGRVSDRFTNYGIRYSFGRRQGKRIWFISPSVNLRVKNLTMGINSEILRHKENQYQHIVTMNYDFSPQIGIGGRLISQKEGTNFYLSFRRSGYAGLEMFLIIGDANAEKFQKRLVAKLVLPL